MVDCGIMDSDSFPYPDVSSEELAETDYLFLTHCHKDHCGAFERLVEQGFRGVLVTTQMTLTLSQINYSNTIILPTGFMNGAAEFSLEGITLNYGRSGHCPGGIWLSVQDMQGSVFFSGDYQADTLAYICNRVQERSCLCFYRRNFLRQVLWRIMASWQIRKLF